MRAAALAVALVLAGACGAGDVGPESDGAGAGGADAGEVDSSPAAEEGPVEPDALEAARGAWPLVLAEDFVDAGALEAFAFSDPAAWRWSDAGGVPSLELHAASDYAPPHRSPLNVALLSGLSLGDFDLEVDALQTGREYGHRDLCLFLAFEGPDRFHYVHLATTPDANAHNVFVVDGAPRRNLLEPREAGVDWGDGWHRLRVERRQAEGVVRVWFDDDEEPTLETTDAELGPGLVGLGSFDDTGRFARLRIWAPTTSRGDFAPFAR